MATRKLDTAQFSAVASDLVLEPDKPKYNPVERNVEQELFKRGAQQETIDKFEHQVLGIKSRSATTKPNIVHKSKMFSLGTASDRETFNSLLNDKRYALIKMDTNWTPMGEYLAFVIYTENLDYKENE